MYTRETDEKRRKKEWLHMGGTLARFYRIRGKRNEFRLERWGQWRHITHHDWFGGKRTCWRERRK